MIIIQKINLQFKKAFVLPLALFFLFLMVAFGYMLLNFNVQSKKQQRATIMETKAYFMALAGLQQFKLKYLMLPEDFFKANTIYYGFSPFYIPPKGKPFDLFDDAKMAGPFFYPEFLGAYLEDINSFYNDPDGSVKDGKTVAGVRKLIKSKDKDIKQTGNIPTWHFSLGGFPLDDSEALDSIKEWGYKITFFQCGSIQKEFKNGLPVIEQSITIAIEGVAKSNVSILSLNRGESEFKKNEVKETMVLRREVIENINGTK